MDADRQCILVGVPQFLKDIFRQKPRVGEHERRAVCLDLLDQLRDRPCRGVAAPGNALDPRQEDFQLGIGALLPLDQRNTVEISPWREPAAIVIRVGQRRRERCALQVGAQRLQPRQGKRQQIAPLAGGESVDLVDHDALETAEQFRGFRIAEQQRERFRCRQQHVRRTGALPRLAIRRRIPAAGLHPNGQSDLLDRGDQVALDIVRQSLER